MEIISIKKDFFDIQKHPRGSTDFSIHGCSNKMKTITSTTNQPVSSGLSMLKMKECSVSSAVHIIQ